MNYKCPKCDQIMEQNIYSNTTFQCIKCRVIYWGRKKKLIDDSNRSWNVICYGEFDFCYKYYKLITFK